LLFKPDSGFSMTQYWLSNLIAHSCGGPHYKSSKNYNVPAGCCGIHKPIDLLGTNLWHQTKPRAGNSQQKCGVCAELANALEPPQECVDKTGISLAEYTELGMWMTSSDYVP